MATGTILGRAIIELLGDSAQFRAEMLKAEKSFDRTTSELRKAGGILTRSVTLPLLALGAGAVVVGTRMDSLERALVAVEGSSEAANRRLVELREAAKLPGLGFAEAIQGQVRLEAVGVEANRATRILKAFGNAIATTGGGAAELNRVTVQIGQLSAKGKILAQDLRPIIEAAPAVGRALREAFGTVDAQEIEALGLSTDKFLDILVTQLEKLPQITTGPKNAFENLKDALFVAGSTIGRSLLPPITKMVEKFTDLLNGLSQINPAIIKWGIGLGIAAAVIGPMLTGLANLALAIRTLSRAFVILNASIGPAGWIALGVTAATAAFVAWRAATLGQADAQKQLNTALDDFKVALDQVKPEDRLKKAKEFEAAITKDLERQKELRDALEAASRRVPTTGEEAQAVFQITAAFEEAKKKVTELEQRLQAAKKVTASLDQPNFSPKGGEEIKEIVDDLQTALRVAGQLRELAGKITFTGAGGETLQRQAGAFEEAEARADALRTAIVKLLEAGVRLDTKIPGLGKTIRELAAELRETERAASGVFEPVLAAIPKLSLVPVTIKGLDDALKKLQKDTALTLSDVVARLRDAGTSLNEIFATLTGAGVRTGDAIRALIDNLSAFEITGLNAVGNLASGFGNFVANSIGHLNRLGDNFKQFASNLIKDVVRMVAELAVLEGILALLGGPATAAGAIFGGFFGLGRRAGGGPVRSGQPYLVGEKGPEIFVPQSAGSVVANQMAVAGGGTIRFDMSSLPPYPSRVTPEAIAQDDWWRRAFSRLTIDYKARGGL